MKLALTSGVATSAPAVEWHVGASVEPLRGEGPLGTRTPPG